MFISEVFGGQIDHVIPYTSRDSFFWWFLHGCLCSNSMLTKIVKRFLWKEYNNCNISTIAPSIHCLEDKACWRKIVKMAIVVINMTYISINQFEKNIILLHDVMALMGSQPRHIGLHRRDLVTSLVVRRGDFHISNSLLLVSK